MWGPGLRAWGLRFAVHEAFLGLGLQGLEFKGLGFKGLGFRVVG